MTTFSQGKYALSISDRSGMAFPYNEMVREWTGAWVHMSEYEPKSPQLDPKPTSADPQALQRARPARTEFPTEDFLPDNPVTTTAADATVSIAFENGAMQVDDFVRLRDIKSPVGGVAVSTLQLSTTLNGAITDSATTITLTDGSEFPTSGFIVIEKVLTSSDTSDPLKEGTYQNEVIEYTGRSTHNLTGCTRGTSATYRGVSPQKTVADSHATGAKVYGAYKIATLSTKQELAGYNDSAGNPAYTTIQTGFTFELVSNASSTETGGGLQCTVGPINDRG
jgi:hypothetical protein